MADPGESPPGETETPAGAADDGDADGRRWGWRVMLVGATVLVLGVVLTGYLLNRAGDAVTLADRLEPPSGAVPTAPQLRPGEVLARLPAGSAVLSTVSVQPHGHSVEARRLSDGSLWWSFRRPSATILALARTGPTSAAVVWDDGRLEVLDSLTGRAVWTRQLTLSRTVSSSGDVMLGVTSAPLGGAAPRALVVTLGDLTQAYDAERGTPLWQHAGTFESASSTVVVLATRTPSPTSTPSPDSTPSSEPTPPSSPSAAGPGTPTAPDSASPAPDELQLLALDAVSGRALGVLSGRWSQALTVPSVPEAVMAGDDVTLGVAVAGGAAHLFAFPPLAVAATSPPASSGGPSGAPTGESSTPPAASSSPPPATSTAPTAGASGAGTTGAPNAGSPGPTGSPGAPEETAGTPRDNGVLAGTSPWWEKSFSVGSDTSLAAAVAVPLADLAVSPDPAVVVLHGSTLSAYTVREGMTVAIVPTKVAVSGDLVDVSVVRDRLVISTTGEVLVVGLDIRAPV
ncbi:MAG: hypothetical protein ACTHK1_05380 [Actinomycetales bacterium]